HRALGAGAFEARQRLADERLTLARTAAGGQNAAQSRQGVHELRVARGQLLPADREGVPIQRFGGCRSAAVLRGHGETEEAPRPVRMVGPETAPAGLERLAHERLAFGAPAARGQHAAQVVAGPRDARAVLAQPRAPDLEGLAVQPLRRAQIAAVFTKARE